jgi:hypothetical protein
MKKLMFILLLILTHLSFSVGCSKKNKSQSPIQSGEGTEAPIEVRSELNQKLFQFEPKKIIELTLIRIDPAFKDNFSFTFLKNGDDKLRDEDQWEMKSATHLDELKDRLANGNWIEHFLDTLTTLTPREVAGEAPLNHFGLDPPRYIIQMKTKTGHSVEVHLGDTAHSPSSRWGRLPHHKEGITKPMRYEGAAIQMLSLIQTPQFLRRERILISQADDIDLIQKTYQGKTTIDVEREGIEWVTPKTRKKVKAPIAKWLEALTHLRAKRFIEAEPELKLVEELFRKNDPTTERIRLDFTNRKNEIETLEARIKSGKVWARLSRRLGVIFELHKDAIPTLRGP